jgi:hypothetical protein
MGVRFKEVVVVVGVETEVGADGDAGGDAGKGWDI